MVLLSSGKVPLADGDLEDFEEKLEAVCRGLAEDVVRNGEGTGHVMEVGPPVPNPNAAGRCCRSWHEREVLLPFPFYELLNCRIVWLLLLFRATWVRSGDGGGSTPIPPLLHKNVFDATQSCITFHTGAHPRGAIDWSSAPAR